MPYCPSRLCKRRYFETDHALFQHARTSARAHPCCITCKRTFKDIEAYTQHRESKHLLHCNTCKCDFPSEGARELHRHTSANHPSCPRCDLGICRREALTKVSCVACNGREFYVDELEGHCHNPSHRPRCDRCGVGFETLDQHNTSHYSEQGREAYPSTFATAQELEPHIKESSGHPVCISYGNPLGNRTPSVHALSTSCTSSYSTRPAVISIPHLKSSSTASPIVRVTPTQFYRSSPTPSNESKIFDRYREHIFNTAPDASSCLSSVFSPSSSKTMTSTIGTLTPLPETDEDVPAAHVLGNTLNREPSLLRRPTPFHMWGRTEKQNWASPSNNRSTDESVDSPVSTPRQNTAPSVFDEFLFHLPSIDTHNLPKSFEKIRDATSFSLDDTPRTARSKGPLARTSLSGDLSHFHLLKGVPSPVESLRPLVSPSHAQINETDSANGETSVQSLSFHCRVCRADPCRDVTATACGHIFCYDCIAEEVRTTARCPVCDAALMLFSLLKLDVS